MTLSMSRCIGQAGCTEDPSAGRGLCMRCYQRHSYRGTLGNFPTMRERTAKLITGNAVVLPARQSRRPRTSTAAASRRYRDARQAERVLLDGYLVHPDAPHGQLNSYISYGCRGPMCYAAQKHYRATSETFLPGANQVRFSVTACLAFRSDVYPDGRR